MLIENHSLGERSILLQKQDCSESKLLSLAKSCFFRSKPTGLDIARLSWVSQVDFEVAVNRKGR